MTARLHYEPDAGPWVAYRENDEGRDYIWRLDARYGIPRVWQYQRKDTPPPHDALRFDTKAEALTAIRTLGRVRGIRTGAVRVP